MTIKLDTKIKWKESFIFFQIKEREKRKEKKKNHQNHIGSPLPLRASWMDRSWWTASNIASRGSVWLLDKSLHIIKKAWASPTC